MKSLLRPFAVRSFTVFATLLLCVLCSTDCYGQKVSPWPSKPSPPPVPAPAPASTAKSTAVTATQDSVIIPGPLRSFLRMAGISQKISVEDVLPLMARNAYMMGYHNGSQTEFLILLDRYVYQARELQILAGSNNTIRVNGCDDAGTLIQILGYRLRQGCGQKNVALETANPERAFLTIDSGFPLTELEEALQKGVPFTYPYHATRVPVLFKESDWVALSGGQKRHFGNLVDVLGNDQAIARLYWAMAKADAETSLELARTPGLTALLPLAPSIDFYGSQITIRSGHVAVPGGAEQGWKELVGASPTSPGDFVTRLLTKDNGWLAAYFDVLTRISKEQQERLTGTPRLKHFYEAFRPTDTETTATRGMFRKAPELLVLFTRLEWEPDGAPYIPGNVEVWKQIFHQKTDSKTIREMGKRAQSWDSPEQILQGMIGLSRIDSDSGPLQIYLMLSEIDRERGSERRLSAETVRLMADRFSQFSTWYLIFSEFPELNDASITSFLHTADSLNGISNQILRGNSLGTFQANIGLWQVLAYQGEIPKTDLNASWQKTIEPFAKISSSTQLFDATRSSLGEITRTACGKPNCSQDEVIELLAGPRQDSPEGQRVRTELAGKIRTVLEDQRLVSMDTLFALSDGLVDLEQGKVKGDKLLPLAGELREFEMPRPIFTKSEKISWAPAVYSSHHAELQIRTDLTKVIKGPGSREQLETARGQLAPFLRDTLVGLNYAYYEPPGAQVLHNNPLFVRSHDFLGISVIGAERLWQSPMLLGAGSPAGGGAYLMGSLADLSYALATTEQDFISPENVQALIWRELVPALLVSATLPRWWNVSPNELHAAALYQKSGEEILIASTKDAQLRTKVIGILSDRMGPQRLEQTKQALTQAEAPAAILPRVMPAETFYLAAEFRKRFPEEGASWGPSVQQLDNLMRQYPTEAGPERVSKDFGVPHPTLARTYTAELLNVKPFPFFGGYSSRLFGESWESSNLYWARLADETGYSPVILNRLIPELTHHMIAKIFATELEDWPAMLRAMQETGDEFRQGKIALLPGTKTNPSSEQAARDGNAQ